MKCVSHQIPCAVRAQKKEKSGRKEGNERSASSSTRIPGVTHSFICFELQEWQRTEWKEDEKVEEARAEEAEKEVSQRKKKQEHRDHSLGSCDLALNDKWQLGSRVGNSTLHLFTLNISHSFAAAVTDHSWVSTINTIIWELWYGSAVL